MPFHPRHACLVGVDSDGCVFDTMEVKQLRHFLPRIIDHWELDAIAPQVAAVVEHINLRSRWRGSNRFAGLRMTFDILRDWPETREAGIPLPPCRDLAAWVDSGEPLSNATLAPRAANSPELKKVLEWSLDVNRSIAETMDPVPPFSSAREALERLRARADMLVVSLTPREALEHEWEFHGLRDKVDAIAGQEAGTKTEQLRVAMDPGGYPPDQVLVIGDAPGDLRAAREVGACFYPILSGQEERCWRRLVEEDIGRFFSGTYRGASEDARVAEFETLLNAPAPWETR